MQDWRQRRQVSGVATNESPAVTVFQDRLYMAWGGLGNPNIYWSFFDGQDWATFPDGQRQPLTDALTARGPALLAFHPLLIPLSQATRLSGLPRQLKLAAFQPPRLVSQAPRDTAKSRQLTLA